MIRSLYEDLFHSRTAALMAVCSLNSLLGEMGELLRVDWDQPYPTDRIEYAVSELQESAQALNDILWYLDEVETAPDSWMRPGWIEKQIEGYREVKQHADQNFAMLLGLRKATRSMANPPPATLAEQVFPARVRAEMEWLAVRQLMTKVSSMVPLSKQTLFHIHDLTEPVAVEFFDGEYELEQCEYEEALMHFDSAYWNARYAREYLRYFISMIETVGTPTDEQVDDFTEWFYEAWDLLVEDLAS